MKILCYINHFFGQHKTFIGKSSLPDGMDSREVQERKKIRKEIVEKVISQIKSLGDDVTVKVCGIDGFTLVPIDIDFSHIKNAPLLLIYESINRMVNYLEEYDYFINLEDDTFIPKETFENIIHFDKSSFLNEILLPNRLEHTKKGEVYCPDLRAIQGWTSQFKNFEGKSIRVAYNPHSALMIISKAKFKYALTQLDLSFRKNILFNELDSAFAYFHSVFSLYRSEDLRFHYVYHLDRWLNSPGEKQFKIQTSKQIFLYVRELFPPILFRIYRYLKRKINDK